VKSMQFPHLGALEAGLGSEMRLQVARSRPARRRTRERTAHVGGDDVVVVTHTLTTCEDSSGDWHAQTSLQRRVKK
jgi:hypothetical protein